MIQRLEKVALDAMEFATLSTHQRHIRFLECLVEHQCNIGTVSFIGPADIVIREIAVFLTEIRKRFPADYIEFSLPGARKNIMSSDFSKKN